MKAGEKSIVRRVNWVGQAPLLTLLVLCVVTALLTSRFLSPLNLTNILVQSSIMAVIAMGMTFVIVGGGFDLSVGSTVALSGCIAGMAMLKFGILAGVVAGIAAGAIVGLANGLVVAMLRVNPFIATLGSMVLVRGVVYIITGGAPVSGEDGLPGAFIAFGVRGCSASTISSGCRRCCSARCRRSSISRPTGGASTPPAATKKRPISPALPCSASSPPPTSGAARLPASPASCWRRGCNRASRLPANSTN
jgi:hypothetical protein